MLRWLEKTDALGQCCISHACPAARSRLSGSVLSRTLVVVLIAAAVLAARAAVTATTRLPVLQALAATAIARTLALTLALAPARAHLPARTSDVPLRMVLLRDATRAGLHATAVLLLNLFGSTAPAALLFPRTFASLALEVAAASALAALHVPTSVATHRLLQLCVFWCCSCLSRTFFS